MAKLKKEDVLDYLESASMLEVSELITDIEEKFNVTAAAPVAVAAAPGGAGEASVAEEKSDFGIELTEVGAKKINVIKVIREITSLGLKEAKDLVESAPTSVKSGIGNEEAQQLKEKLEAAGAVVKVE